MSSTLSCYSNVAAERYRSSKTWELKALSHSSVPPCSIESCTVASLLRSTLMHVAFDGITFIIREDAKTCNLGAKFRLSAVICYSRF